jgi:uncharacterized protein YegJ (DUF2314 family)
MDDFYFPNLDEHGWTLDDGEVANKANPDTYYIPPLAERSTLKKGDMAKIRFLYRDKLEDPIWDPAERMWVEVIGFQGDYYIGRLSNDPVMTELIAWGQLLFFEPRHVTNIIRKADSEE